MDENVEKFGFRLFLVRYHMYNIVSLVTFKCYVLIVLIVLCYNVLVVQVNIIRKKVM